MKIKKVSAVVLASVLLIQGQAAMGAEFSDGSFAEPAEFFSQFTYSETDPYEEQVLMTEVPETGDAEFFETVEAEEEEAFEETVIGETVIEEAALDEEEFSTEEAVPEIDEILTEEDFWGSEETPGIDENADMEEFPEEIAPELKTDFIFENEEVKIIAKVMEGSGLPVQTEMKAVRLVEGTAEFEAAKNAAASSLEADETAVYIFYDVTFEADGQEVKPADGTVSIQVEFKTMQKDETAEKQSILHIDETEAGNIVRDVTAETETGNNMNSVDFAF